MKTSQIQGSGILFEENRNLPEFSGIELSGAYEVSARCGQKQEFLISGDDNIVPLVKTEVKGNTLKVTLKQSVSTRKKITLTIAAKIIDSLKVFGAVKADIAGVSGTSFKLEIPGAGEVKLEGAVDALEISMPGAGNVNAKNLIATTADVDVRGAGNVVLTVSGELKASIRGVGNVDYYGNPGTVKEKISGIGRIRKR